jgi:hypothetical protein
MIQVPDGHHVVLLKKDLNEPLDMDLTWRQVRDTYGYFSPDPDNRIQMHFGFHITPVVEIREDSRPHKGLGPTRL